MTDKSEVPFAEVKNHGVAGWFIECAGQAVSEYFDTEGAAILVCDEINTAFEKAVAKREAKSYAAGFKAGMERAMGIVEEYAGKWDQSTGVNVAIRAEIEKI